jgi:hypothetical protein
VFRCEPDTPECSSAAISSILVLKTNCLSTYLFALVEAYKRGVDLSDASRADDLPSNGPLRDIHQ